MSCPSCCSACSAFTELPGPYCINNGPYGLSNFLPAGTLQFDLLPLAGVVQRLCDHTHSDDGWHHVRVHTLLPCFDDTDNIRFCQDLDFLIENHFISATYRFCPPATIIVRIYIIPYDLGNVKGVLRVRKEAVLAPARRYLKGLLQRITQDNESWHGNAPSNRRFCFLSADNDNRTLAEIYADLPSPQITTSSIPSECGNIVGRLLNFRDDLGGLGMRSTLYKYQRRSVASMLQKELDPRDVPDPLFIPLVGVNGEEFYFQPGTMEILRERPMVAPNRGGILCEELGTGKTVMTLALVLATIEQLPAPEGSILGTQPVMTPLAFRHFPSSHYAATREQFLREKKEMPNSQHSRVPSLVELLLHRSRTVPDTTILDTTTTDGMLSYEHKLNIAERLELSHFPQLRTANVPFYHQYQGEPTNNERTRRDQSNPGPRVMYLTSATLILVPPNLISQWDREIQKHCEYPLRVILLRSRDPMPAVKSLASDYDIILMARDRFTAEDHHKDISKLYSWKTCNCLTFPGSRIPNCQCKPSVVSPLLQIRWKRLVIDEGHVSATQSTILTPFTKLLSVERIWIITGTPTTNLLGLSLGKKLNDEGQLEDDLEGDNDDDLEGYHVDDLYGDCNDLPAEESSQSDSPAPFNGNSTPRTRIWNKYDREDLQKLGNMITHFVGVPQFIAAPKLFKTRITDPLLDTLGPRPGAIQALNQVMNMVMVRHQIGDVEEDVVLPPIKQEAILLDLDPYAAKSYNALQATIAINAVDSQRTDQDYMFHPKNSEFLQLTVENMSQIMFWSVDDRLHNVDQLLKDSDEHLHEAIKRGVSQEDLALLRDAVLHVRSAAEDALWRAMQKDVFVPYRVYGMNWRVFEAWTRTTGSEPTLDPSFVGFMHPDRFIKVRHLVIGRPLSSEDTMVERGLALAENDRKQSQTFEELESRRSKRKSNRKSTRQYDESYGSLKAVHAASKATSPKKLKEMRTELRKALAKLDSLENEEAGPTRGATRVTSSVSTGQPSKLLTCSLLANVRVRSSASSKLNYIINEVIQHAHSEKFLIFSQSGLSLAHVADALELIQVKCLRLSTQDPPRVREQQVMTFETSDAFRVFLMELRHGARGLNLISASRVIFCEPVWQADVESQAIKRAHRIGQTRPISVKTLAIRGTAEENMVARRNALQGSGDKLPKLTEEAGMRHYIANPKFINYPPTFLPTLDVPLIKLSHDEPVQTSEVVVTAEVPAASYQGRVRAGDSTDQLGEPPRKKAKGVTFAN